MVRGGGGGIEESMEYGNGMAWSGMESGMEWHGMAWNNMEWRGVAWSVMEAWHGSECSKRWITRDRLAGRWISFV